MWPGLLGSRMQPLLGASPAWWILLNLLRPPLSPTFRPPQQRLQCVYWPVLVKLTAKTTTGPDHTAVCCYFLH